jgi:diguanylate cyclase (GGDEF)-like protein
MRIKVRRPADLTARYGGEEFAVIMPETDGKGAWYVAEGIRLELAKMEIPHSKSPAAPYVTISFGIASMFPGADAYPHMLIQNADRALYQAKQQGRNRVVRIDGPFSS